MHLRSKQKQQSAVAHRAGKVSNFLRAGAIFLAGGVCGLQGCGSGGIPPSYTGSTGTTTPSMSNNWEFAVTAATPGTTGSLSDAITLLSGSIVTSNADAEAVFQAASKSCYLNAPVIPLLGTINGTSFTAQSFAVKGQFLHMTGTFDSTASHLSGNYDIGGGCSQGETGTFAGTRFASLTGTYAGNISTGASSTAPATLTLTQSSSPTGQGSFIVSGTAAIPNFSCFTSGTIGTGSGYVSGSNVTMTFASPTSAGGALTLNGKLTSDALTLTIPQAVVSNTGCAGNYGSIVLTRK